MSAHLMPLPLTWRPLLLPGLTAEQVRGITAKLSRVLDSWLGTPYMAGNAAKGAGVDCIRFVCSALDEMYGFQREKFERLPLDIALHRPATARAALRRILTIYEPHERVDDGSLEPGDIVVVSPSDSAGPSHAKIAGTSRNVLYHATADGIVKCGIVERTGSPFAVYRLRDRERWAA